MAEDNGENRTARDAAIEGLNTITLTAVQALRGSHAIEGASFEATFIAYRQLRFIAESVAERVAAAKTGTAGAVVLVVEDGIDTDLVEFKEVEARINQAALLVEELKGNATELLGSSKVASVGLVGSVVSAGLAVASLFSHDTSERNFPITIDNAALTLLVQRKLRGEGLTLLTAGELMHEGLKQLNGNRPEGALADCLRQLRGFARDLRGFLGQVLLRLPEPTRAKDGQDNTMATPDQITDDMTKLKLRLESAIKDVEAIEAGLWARARKLARGAAAQGALGTGGRLLVLRVLAGGGATVTDKAVGKDAVEHAGGVLVSYALYEADGKFVEADVLVGHERVAAGPHQPTSWEDWRRGLSSWSIGST